LGALRPPTPIDPRLADPDPERLLALVEEAADAMRDTKGVDYASTSLVTHHGRFVVANTNGLLVWDQNAHEAFAGEVRGAHEAEARTKRVAIQERRALDATRDLAAPLRDAVALATQRGAREPLGSAVSDVILDAGAAVQLVSQLLASFAGHGANDGRSRFAGKIGERVASENVTIVDDPTDGVGIRNYRVDDEGTPTRGALTIIERGTLVSHAHDFRSAQAAGRDATGHGLRSLNGRYGATPSARLGNAVVEPGRESLAQIVEGAERAVLLQGSLLGSFTINTITGDVACTSPMAHLVDGGKVVAQLRPVTLGGNLFDALKDCRAIGASGLRYPRGSCPALRLGKLTAMT
jgi:PmbA protein